jgi:ureidoacrylate peracid hydrolase
MTDHQNAVDTLRGSAARLINEWGRPGHLFAPDRERAAFIVIDMQNFACQPHGGHVLPGIREAGDTINRVADQCRRLRIPVVWIRQNFTVDEKGNDAGLYPLFHRQPLSGDLCNRSWGTGIHRELHYDPALDHQLFKNRYSPFIPGASNLAETLKSLGRRQLIIAGVAANVCVESTVRDAMQLDYEVILLRDGISTFDELLLEATLANVRLFFGDVRTSEEVLEALGPLPE